MAEEGRGRQADGEGVTNPYCYHIDQFGSCGRSYAGHRVLPEDGPRHDPGRPRGFARPARAQFHLRPRCAPPTGCRPIARSARRSAREFGIIACFMCKPFMGVSANGCHHNISLVARRRVNVFMPDTDDVHKPWQDRAPGDRRHRRASPRPLTRDTALDGQLLSASLGHRLLGAGVRRLGLPEPHHRAARLGARPLRVPRRGLRGATRT